MSYFDTVIDAELPIQLTGDLDSIAASELQT